MLSVSARQVVVARMLAAFQIPEYRPVWANNFLNWSGRLMAMLTLGWLTLELTDSAFWVGLVAGLGGVGMLVFSVLGGFIVDRFDRRRTIIVATLANGSLLLGLAALVSLGRAQPWHLLVMAVVFGSIDAIQTPAVGTVMFQVVGRERLMNAAAGLMLSFNLGRFVGSALGGSIIEAWGAGPAFACAAAALGLAALAMLWLPGTYRSGAERGAFWSEVGAGLQYARKHATVRQLLTLSVIVETLGFSYSYMMPVVARDVLQVGPAGLGWLSSVGGLGAVAGTVLMAWLGDARNKGALLMVACGVSGTLLLAFALSRSYPLSLALAGLAGASLVSYDILMQTLVQLVASDEVRGRVYSLYSLTFGFNSLGGFLGGWLANTLGAPLAIGAAGGLLVAYSLRVAGFIRHVVPDS
jgi:predicted MFS family arabinose efflux permease